MRCSNSDAGSIHWPTAQFNRLAMAPSETPLLTVRNASTRTGHFFKMRNLT
jgi:hypothetical protein